MTLAIDPGVDRWGTSVYYVVDASDHSIYFSSFVYRCEAENYVRTYGKLDYSQPLYCIDGGKK